MPNVYCYFCSVSGLWVLQVGIYSLALHLDSVEWIDQKIEVREKLCEFCAKIGIENTVVCWDYSGVAPVLMASEESKIESIK